MQDVGLHTVNLLCVSYLKVIRIFPIFQSTSALTKPLKIVSLKKKKKSLADISFMCHRLLNEKQLITRLAKLLPCTSYSVSSSLHMFHFKFIAIDNLLQPCSYSFCTVLCLPRGGSIPPHLFYKSLSSPS